jgi:RNA polymerase sigma factor (sigma-70 family)
MPDRFDTNTPVHEKLLAKVLLGDNGAARMLVGLLAPIIRRVANRVAPPNLREDLIQEAWTHLWSNNGRVLQQWNHNGPLVHYVAVVASNLMRDRLARRTIVTEPIEACFDPPDADDPTRTLEVKQLIECLEKAKSRLSEQMHRDLIYMRYELGLKHREIATKLGMAIGSVGTTLARVERYLRDKLMETCADHLDSFRSIF